MDIRLLKAMVIGDGCLDFHQPKYRNARFTCLHSVAQKDYALWKRDLLVASGLKVNQYEYWNTINPYTRKKGLMIHLESVVSPVLTVLRGQMYPKIDGFKPGILDDLEELHLAIIFMDDGCRAVLKKHCGVPCDPFIHQFRFSLQSHGFGGSYQFADWMKQRFGIRARVWKQAQQPVVIVNKLEDKERFREIVSPFLHPSMSYKVDGQFRIHTHRDRLSERASLGMMRQSELARNESQEGESKNLPASWN